MGLIYFDSSVALDAVDPTAPRHARIDAAILASPLTEFAISDLVRLECSVQAIRDNDASRMQDLSTFFTSVNVLLMPPAVFDRAARVRADHPKVKTPDALHIATALHHGCAEFWTNDLELAKKDLGLTFRTF